MINRLLRLLRWLLGTPPDPLVEEKVQQNRQALEMKRALKKKSPG